MASPDPNALLTGASWASTLGAPQVVTYSFAQDGAGGVGTALAAGRWAPFSAAQQASTRLALAAWSATSGLTFIEVPDTAAGVGIDLRFRLEKLGVVGQLGFAYGPPFGNVALDLSLFGADSLAPSPSRVGFSVLLHEIGHGIGLKHPWEGDITLPAELRTPATTVMAYIGRSALLPQAPQPLDAEAAQLLYGTPGASSVRWSWDAAELTIVGQGSAADELLAAPAHGALLLGGGGNDTLQGGAGVDVAGFDCTRAEATLRGDTVTTAGGTTVLREIDALAFTDGRLALTEADTAAAIADLYRAALGRAPDPIGLVTWLGVIQAGGSLHDVAQEIVSSAEFKARFGILDDAGFANLLGRHGADAAAALARQEAGWDRAAVLVAAADDAPVRAATNTLLDQGRLWAPMATGAELARLYHIALGQAPDPEGWSAAFKQVLHGRPLHEVAAALAPGADPVAMLPHWLEHGLGHAPDAATLAQWQAEAASASVGELLVALAEDPGVVAALKPVTEPGILFA